MMTNSYLEYFLTLLGWLINNGLWELLVSTGLFVLPLLFKATTKPPFVRAHSLKASTRRSAICR